MASELNLVRVEFEQFESDCLQLVKAMKTRITDAQWESSAVLEDILEVLDCNVHFSISSV